MTACSSNWISSYCRLATETMLRNESTQDLIRKTKFGVDAYLRNRKLVAITLILLLFMVYIFPQYFGLSSATNYSAPSYICLNDQLRQFAREESSFTAVVQHWPHTLEWEKEYMPFVGNGRLGIGIDGVDERVYIRQGTTLSLPVDLRPLVIVRASGHSSDAIITQYPYATVTKLNCYEYENECIVVASSTYIHRIYSKLIVQKINVRNPLSTSLDLSVTRDNPRWKFETTKSVTVGGLERSVSIVSSKVDAGNAMFIVVSAVLPHLPRTFTVKPRSSQDFRFLTLVDYSEPMNDEYFSNNRDLLEKQILAQYENMVKIDGRSMDKAHENAWDQIYRPSFGMSYSRAPNVLNSDLVNATRYMLLANTPAIIHEFGMAVSDVEKWKASMQQNELCYNAHPTMMYPSQLWSTLRSVKDIREIAFKWFATLQKNGCLRLVEAGADGVSMAFVLSLGGLKFTHHHLELTMHPADLHRDATYKNIAFSNASAEIDVKVEVGEDNKALLYAAVKNIGKTSKSHFYACDAGCLDPPVELKETEVAFPVKLTDPVTAILYITEDMTHIEELKHTIHVKEVAIAPAHEHHLMALHKHGHRLGGLPVIFWICLAFLIITFHLFLFKLIFNEYCRDEKGVFTRARYQV